jgi:hypothetical protein
MVIPRQPWSPPHQPPGILAREVALRYPIPLMERWVDTFSHPMQPCATIAPFVNVRLHFHQLIRLWAQLSALRSCMQ